MSASPFFGLLTHAESEGPLLHVWLQHSDDKRIANIEIILNNFNSIFESGLGVVAAEKLTNKQMVCVQVEEDWLRGEVKKVDVSGGVADVHFIDIGHTCQVKCESIRSLTLLREAPLVTTAPLATKYTLAGVKCARDMWEETTIESLNRNFTNRKLMCTEVSEGFISLSYDEKQSDLSTLLITLQCAVPISVAEQQVLTIALRAPPSSQHNFSLEPMKELEFRIPNVFEVGSSHSVTVSAVEKGPNLFSIQLESNELLLANMMMQLNMQELQPLSDMMALPGTACAAHFTKDGTLCRGIIMQLYAEELCKVLLIDYGTVKCVPYQELFELPLKFQLLKPMATKFCLRGAKELPASLLLMQSWFVEIVIDQPLRMLVVPKSGHSWKQCCELQCKNNDVLTLLKERVRKEGRTYQKVVLEENKEYHCAVSCVSDTCMLPWTFCIQLNSHMEQLDSIMAQVGEYCKSVAATGVGQTGDPLFAQYPGGTRWYRCQLKERKSDSALVEFVDYGYCEEVDLLNIRAVLPELVAAMPAQAITCRLQSADTMADIMSQFIELTENKVVNVKVVKQLAGGEMLVRLYDPSTSPALDLTSQLVFGSQLSTGSPQPSVPDPQLVSKKHTTKLATAPQADITREPNKEKSCQETKVEAKRYSSKMDQRWYETKPRMTVQVAENKWEHDMFAAADGESRSTDNHGVGRGFRQRSERESSVRSETQSNGWRVEVQPRGERYNRQRDRPDKYDRQKCEKWEDTTDNVCVRKEQDAAFVKSYTSDGAGKERGVTAGGDATKREEDPIAKLSFSPVCVLPGDKLRVYATFMMNPAEFYVQLEASGDQLQTLMDQIMVICDNNERATLAQVAQLQPPDACLARFTQDNTWYRAQILSVSEAKVKVKFVDYGNMLDVNVSDLKLMTPELLSLPAQAISCCLRGVKPATGDQWSEEQLKHFSAAMEDVCLQADVIGLMGLRLRQYSVVLHSDAMCLNTAMGASPDSLLPCTSLASEDLPIDSTHQVHISWFLTPDNFHVMLKQNVQERDWMYNEFADMECPKLKSVEVENLVLARKNNVHFRGKVLATRDTQARVKHLDVGNIQICETSELYVMPESLKSTPAFAVACAMSGITPTSGPEWSRNCDAINSVFKSAPSFSLRVQDQHASGKVLVSLQAGDKDVAQTLVERGLAACIKKQEDQLSPGHSCKVVVCYADGPHSFYVHEEARTDALDKMQDSLQKLECSERMVPYCPLFAARHADGDVFRAKLLSPTQVMFVDYGFVGMSVAMSPMPAKLCDVPPFAHACRLAVLSPPGETWPHQSVARFQALVFDERTPVTARVLTQHGGCLLVDLVLDNATSLVDTLLKEQLARPMMWDAYVSCVESASNFHIQRVQDESMLQQIADCLATVDLEDAGLLEVGMECVAKFSADDAWYRARVLAIQDDTARVQFMDYGNCAEASEFRKMPEDLSSVTAVAIACSLACKPVSEQDFVEVAMDGTVILQVLFVDDQQTPAQVIVLRDGKHIVAMEEEAPVSAVCDTQVQPNTEPLSQDNTRQITEVMSKDVTKNQQNVDLLPQETTESKINVYVSHYVSPTELYYQKVEDEVSIFTLQEELSLLEQDSVEELKVGGTYAAQFAADSIWYRGTVISLNPTQVYFIDYGNTGTALQLRVLPQQLQNIPAFAHRHTLHFCPSNVHVAARLNEILSDECSVFQLDSAGRMSIHGKNVFELAGYTMSDVVVSHMESPHKFYIQHVSDLDKLESVQASLETGEDLAQVVQGMKCAAKFIEDDNWYRTIITSKQDETIEVFFYDYGNSATASQFKIVPECVLGVPAFALECCLEDIAHLSDVALRQLANLIGDPEGPVFQAYISKSTTESVGVCLLSGGKNITLAVQDSLDKSLKRIGSHPEQLEPSVKKPRTESDAENQEFETSEIKPEICFIESEIVDRTIEQFSYQLEVLKLQEPKDELDLEICDEVSQTEEVRSKSPDIDSELGDVQAEIVSVHREGKIDDAQVNSAECGASASETAIAQSGDQSQANAVNTNETAEKRHFEAKEQAEAATVECPPQLADSKANVEPPECDLADMDASTDCEEHLSIFYSDTSVLTQLKVETKQQPEVLSESEALDLLMEPSVNLQVFQQEAHSQDTQIYLAGLLFTKHETSAYVIGATSESRPSLTVETCESSPSLTVETCESSPSLTAETSESSPSLTAETCESSPSLTTETCESSPSITVETSESSPSLTAETCESSPSLTVETCESRPSLTVETCESSPSITVETCESSPSITVETCESSPSLTVETCESSPSLTAETCESRPSLTVETCESSPSLTAETCESSHVNSMHDSSVYEDAVPISACEKHKDTSKNVNISLYESFTETPDVADKTAELYLSATQNQVTTSTPVVTAKPKSLELADVSPVESTHSESAP